MSRLRVSAFFLSISFCFAAACGQSLPDTPDGTVEAVAGSLAANKPGVLWTFLPESYQRDVQGIISEFAEKMDPEIYDKGFALLNKGLQVLKTKRDFILQTPILQGPMSSGFLKNKEDLKKNWEGFVDFFAIIAKSEAASLATLKTMDVGAFLDDEGAKLMNRMAELSKVSKEDSFNKDFRDEMAKIRIEVVSAEGDRAILEISAPGEKPEEMPFVKVEGKWIPEDMAKEWKGSIAEIEKELEKWTGEDLVEKKPQIMGMMTMIGGVLDRLKGAKSSEEFNEVIMESMQGIFAGGGKPEK